MARPARRRPSSSPGPARNHHPDGTPPPSAQRRPRTTLRLQRVGRTDVWELLHPPCVRERAEDLEEVQQMIDGGEYDVATDELRWLLEGCRDFQSAHHLLGELALLQGDTTLARAHFGYAFQLGAEAVELAWGDGPPRGTISYDRPGNQAFIETGKGLVACLIALGKREQAHDVARQLLAWEPADPLAIAQLVATPPSPGDTATPPITGD